MMTPLHKLIVASSLTLLVACDQDTYLPGERYDVLSKPNIQSQEGETRKIAIPAPKTLASHTSASGVVGPTVNAALSTNPSLRFATSIGTGNSKRARLSAAPIVADGMVFTMDSRSVVSAVSTASGTLAWQTSIAPLTDRGTELIGGGLTFGGGRLYAASAFGDVVALDPKSGETLWTQDVGANANGTPSYSDGRIFVVSATGAAWNLNAKNGRILWRIPGEEQTSGTFGGAAPAITNSYTIYANSAGEILNTRKGGGTLAWINKLAGADKGAAISAIKDIAGSPVVSGNSVYVSNFGGRSARYDLSSGETMWLAPYGTYNTPLVFGDSMFLISNDNMLIRLAQSDGSVIWSKPLPKYTAKRARKRTEIFTHFGPILAGGHLVIASSDGELRFIAPSSGEVVATTSIPHGAATAPVVANGTLYVINTRGELLAFQ